MGASNAMKAFTYWAHLGHRDHQALTFMALVSMDGATPPIYFGGWEAVAKALGLDPEANPVSARKQVEKVFRALTLAGPVISSGAARRGVRAEYALALDPAETWKCWTMSRGTDGIYRGVWTKSERTQTHQNGGAPRNRNGGANTHQNGSKVPTKTVGPRSSQEQPQEQNSGTTSPQAIKSPAPDPAGPIEQKSASEEMICSTCLRRRFRDEMTRTDVGVWVCSKCREAA